MPEPTYLETFLCITQTLCEFKTNTQMFLCPVPASTDCVLHYTQLDTAEWLSSLTQAVSIAWLKGDPEVWFVILRMGPALPTFQTSPSRDSAGIVLCSVQRILYLLSAI